MWKQRTHRSRLQKTRETARGAPNPSKQGVPPAMVDARTEHNVPTIKSKTTKAAYIPAFSPGPGYGLWEFVVMPYGLTGATQTCQRTLDEVFRECHDCVDNYVDDIIVFSDNMESHKADLQRMLQKLKLAGFMLRGSKCFLGHSSTTYLDF